MKKERISGERTIRVLQVQYRNLIIQGIKLMESAKPPFSDGIENLAI